MSQAIISLSMHALVSNFVPFDELYVDNCMCVCAGCLDQVMGNMLQVRSTLISDLHKVIKNTFC